MSGERDIEQRIRSLGTNAALSAAGGCLDAFTYIGHGHVFANAMTGNVVLMATNAAAGNWPQSLRHLPPIFTFLAGVACVRAMGLPRFRRALPVRPFIVLVIEIAAFLWLSWIPSTASNFLMTTVICFVASLQTATFRQIQSGAYNSTFTTGNLRTLSESFVEWAFGGRGPEAGQQTAAFFCVCGAFFLGALAGALLTPRLGNHTLLIVAGGLFGVLLDLIIAKSRRPPAG